MYTLPSVLELEDGKLIVPLAALSVRSTRTTECLSVRVAGSVAPLTARPRLPFTSSVDLGEAVNIPTLSSAPSACIKVVPLAAILMSSSA